MRLDQLKQLTRKGQQLYANKHMRKQWVRKHSYLVETGKHVAINGKYPERAH
jgi:hypothetical protein